ncbi:MAG: biotin--[acetyl-CoA-carboxylase] ligase [Solirubrobacterales bacterium]
MGLTPRTPAEALAGPIVHMGTIGSTNDRARELAAAGAPDRTVLVADRQTAGRGRQGRTWVAPPGHSLTFSLLVRTEDDQLRDLPIVAAVAVCEACERIAGVEAQIKWPNDVWIERRKVAGILIEARPQESWAVVGVGVNVNTSEDEFPPELRESATSLAIASGSEVSRDELLDAMFERLTGLLDERPEAALDAYRTRDALFDRQIEWSSGAGTAKGIDERGNLVVFTGEGKRVALDAGEVHLHGLRPP